MASQKIALLLVLAVLFAVLVCIAQAKQSTDADTLTDEEAEAVIDLLSVASKSRTETFVNRKTKKRTATKKHKNNAEAEADIPGMYICAQMGGRTYLGSYDQCVNDCRSHALTYFMKDAQYQVNWFPSGMFSSGGCGCCGPSRS